MLMIFCDWPLNISYLIQYQSCQRPSHRWVFLLCVQCQERACGPSEGRGGPRLDTPRFFFPLSLPLFSFFLTQLPACLKEGKQQERRVRRRCRHQRQTDGPEVSPPRTIYCRHYSTVNWCSAPDRQPEWRCITGGKRKTSHKLDF